MLAAARLRLAAEIVQAGGLLAYPTETVYGLGCDPGNAAAVARLCALKQRPWRAGLILIAAELEQLAGWIDPDPAELARLCEPTAGPVSWVVTAGPLAARWITGGRRRLAVRLTRHAGAAALCRAAGMPLVSTSANRRGRRPAATALQVRCWLGADLDLVVPGRCGRPGRPSALRDALTGAALRAG